MLAVKVEHLTKRFNGIVAVDDISFRIKQGEIFGLLGPNGAGKTTIISILSTILKPTSGKAVVNNFNIEKEEDDVRRSIGIIFQDQSLDEELTAYENMDFHGRLYRIPKELRKRRITELLRLVSLEERKKDLVKSFSGGMRRRLEIARGLLHEPSILFLDEPTLGLDPQTRNHLWQYIKKLNEDKKITIILTTHYMEEADKLCHNLLIIDKGRIIALDTPLNLKEEVGSDVITIESSEQDSLCSKMKSEIRALRWVRHVQKHNGFITISLKNAERHIAEIVSLAEKNGIAIDSISLHKPTLEDVFLHFTGRTMREEEASLKENMRLRRRIWRR